MDGRYSDEGEKINVAYYMIGQTAFEVMEDMDGTGEVAKFIDKHGEGIMVVSLNVDNTVESLALLKRNGQGSSIRNPAWPRNPTGALPSSIPNNVTASSPR